MVTDKPSLSNSSSPAPPAPWNLRLYVAGQTPKSVRAFDNLKRLCEEHLAGQYSIEVVDLVLNPRLAKEDQIVAIPTLVRRLPDPIRKIIGDLSDTERTLVGLATAHEDANVKTTEPLHHAHDTPAVHDDQDLRTLSESDEVIRAISEGQVDAFVISES